MSNHTRASIFVVNPETGEAEAFTSEELAAKDAPAPEPEAAKPAPRKSKED
jgi:hypothetical protein